MGGDAQGAQVTDVKQPVCVVLPVQTPPQRCWVSAHSGPPELVDVVLPLPEVDADVEADVVLPVVEALVDVAASPPAPPTPSPSSPKMLSEPWAQPKKSSDVTTESEKVKRA